MIRGLLETAQVVIPVFINKSIRGIPRFTPGLWLPTTAELKENKSSYFRPNEYYSIHFLSLLRFEDGVQYCSIKGEHLEPVTGHPLARLCFLDKEYITSEDLKLLEKRTNIIHTIKPTGKMPSISKSFVFETIHNIRNNYEFCWLYDSIAPDAYDFPIVRKIEIYSIKLVLPIFDAKECNGVIVTAYISPVNSPTKTNYISFIMSDFETNITIFDGAYLRNLGTNCGAVLIRKKLGSFSKIYTVQLEETICVE